jgi:hypothetical protein
MILIGMLELCKEEHIHEREKRPTNNNNKKAIQNFELVHCKK